MSDLHSYLELGSAEIAAVTGLKPHGMYSLPKIMWIKGHWPEVYRRAEHILLMEDFVVFLLTGTAQIDYSLATRTMAFDINTITWNRKILSVAGVDERLLSRPVPSGTAAGTLLPEAAKRTGFSTRLQVVSVSQDQVAGAVGAGVFDSGKALECAGTVECLTPVYDGMPPLGGNAPGQLRGRPVCGAREVRDLLLFLYRGRADTVVRGHPGKG